MNFRYISGIILKHILITFKDVSRILNIFYWPFINIIIMGITGIWFEQSTAYNGNFALIFLSAGMFWDISLMITVQVANSLLNEILDKNLANIFTTPIDLSEWIVADIVTRIIDAILVFIFSTFTIWLMFGLNIFKNGWYIIPFTISLMMSGWCIGFFLCGIIMALGKKAIDLIYYIGWFFAPFCAVYYPLKLLPNSLQLISKALPMTYVFEGMRTVLTTGAMSNYDLILSFILNIFYLSISILFFRYMFKRSKINGLANLE